MNEKRFMLTKTRGDYFKLNMEKEEGMVCLGQTFVYPAMTSSFADLVGFSAREKILT